MHTRRILTLMLATLLALGLTGPAALADSGSPIVDGAVYADGELFGTIILGDLGERAESHRLASRSPEGVRAAPLVTAKVWTRAENSRADRSLSARSRMA
jgi:hypothetical protein